MTQANHDTPIRIEVPTIRPDDIMDATRPANYDDLAQLQYKTLASLGENLTESIEEVAEYTESWTYAKDGEPGSYAITCIDDSGVWDKPLVEILRNDPAVSDWRDDELDYLAGLVRSAALRSTRTTCPTLEKYDHYDIQGRVRRLDEQA